MLKKFAVVKWWAALVSGSGGAGGRVAAEDGTGPQGPQPAWGDGESATDAEDFPRPRARPRRRYTRFLREGNGEKRIRAVFFQLKWESNQSGLANICVN